ncbi:hypothetical protein ACA910_011671 [Epithemia clementina (nom. ined.)]
MCVLAVPEEPPCHHNNSNNRNNTRVHANDFVRPDPEDWQVQTVSVTLQRCLQGYHTRLHVCIRQLQAQLHHFQTQPLPVMIAMDSLCQQKIRQEEEQKARHELSQEQHDQDAASITDQVEQAEATILALQTEQKQFKSKQVQIQKAMDHIAEQNERLKAYQAQLQQGLQTLQMHFDQKWNKQIDGPSRPNQCTGTTATYVRRHRCTRLESATKRDLTSQHVAGLMSGYRTLPLPGRT